MLRHRLWSYRRVTRPHGGSGVVKSKFRSNLPPHAFGASVRIVSVIPQPFCGDCTHIILDVVPLEHLNIVFCRITTLLYATMVSMRPLHENMILFGAIIDPFVPSLPPYTTNRIIWMDTRCDCGHKATAYNKPPATPYVAP